MLMINPDDLSITIRNNTVFIKVIPDEKRGLFESYCKTPHIYSEIRRRILGSGFDAGMEDELCHYIAGVVNSVCAAVPIMEVE